MKKYLSTAGAAALASVLVLAGPAHSAITTFATLSALTTDNIYFKNAAANGKSANSSFYSIATPTSKVPGSVGVQFSFINEGPTLGGAVHNVNATFTLNGTSTSAALLFAGYLIQPGVTGSFSIKSTTAITVGSTHYAAGSNLLSATFGGGGIAGPANSTSGGFDVDNQNSGQTLVYTSDFVSFVPTASLDAAFSLTSITPALSRVSSSFAVKTFKADAGGSFSADPVPLSNSTPEPASWAMMLVGFGAIGAIARRRKSIVAA